MSFIEYPNPKLLPYTNMLFLNAHLFDIKNAKVKPINAPLHTFLIILNVRQLSAKIESFNMMLSKFSEKTKNWLESELN